LTERAAESKAEEKKERDADVVFAAHEMENER
jgi:hypothetical protein